MFLHWSMFHNNGFSVWLHVGFDVMTGPWSWRISDDPPRVGRVKAQKFPAFRRQMLVQWIMRLEWSWWRQVHWCLLVGSWCWRTWTEAGLKGQGRDGEDGFICWIMKGALGILGDVWRTGLNLSPTYAKNGTPSTPCLIYWWNHGLTPVWLLLGAVCFFFRWKKVIGQQEDQSRMPNHQSTLSSVFFLVLWAGLQKQFLEEELADQQEPTVFKWFSQWCGRKPQTLFCTPFNFIWSP